MPQAPQPDNHNNITTAECMQEQLFEKHLDVYIKCKSILDSNIQNLYSLVISQCTILLQTKLKQQANWATVEGEQNGITLLGLIKAVVH